AVDTLAEDDVDECQRLDGAERRRVNAKNGRRIVHLRLEGGDWRRGKQQSDQETRMDSTVHRLLAGSLMVYHRKNQEAKLNEGPATENVANLGMAYASILSNISIREIREAQP